MLDKDEAAKPNSGDPEDVQVLLWTSQHNHGSSKDPEQNYNMIVASSDVLLNRVCFRFRAGEPPDRQHPGPVPHQQPDQLGLQTDNAGSMLQKLSMRAVTRYLIGVDINELMGPGRTKAQEELKKAIQQQADINNSALKSCLLVCRTSIRLGAQKPSSPKPAVAWQKVTKK
ncbi:MAG: hypothetical protein Ct9H300mP7_0430 [Verrucomicrobiota bacterium]|nr:MAG: hypothetical protein Ct9H300mP7_0430 [Verrucomicrobiota bacterium]